MPKTYTKQKFFNQWLKSFAPSITKKEYEAHIKGQYIWHVFSWKLIKDERLLTGEAANKAYNLISKENAMCCDFFGDGVIDSLPDEYDTAEKIDKNATELYVVANDFSWTYIKTHENELCGPYFMKL